MSTTAGVPSYSEADVQTTAYKTQDYMRDTGAQSVSDVIARVRADERESEYVMASKVTRDLAESAYQVARDYEHNTDLLAQMNESWNANRYILRTLGGEEMRMKSLNTGMKRDLYKIKEEFAYAAYMTHYYRFVSGAAVFALYITMLLLIPAALWRMGRIPGLALIIVDGIILVFFLIMLIIIFRVAATRRLGAWDQFYWSPGSVVKSGSHNPDPVCTSGATSGMGNAVQQISNPALVGGR